MSSSQELLDQCIEEAKHVLEDNIDIDTVLREVLPNELQLSYRDKTSSMTLDTGMIINYYYNKENGGILGLDKTAIDIVTRCGRYLGYSPSLITTKLLVAEMKNKPVSVMVGIVIIPFYRRVVLR